MKRVENIIHEKRKALGRGLDSLLPGRAPAAAPATAPSSVVPARSTHEIALELIDPNPYQTRRHMNETSLTELADSIPASGLLQPVVLRPGANGRFQLVAGERRWLASKQAGNAPLPAVLRPDF